VACARKFFFNARMKRRRNAALFISNRKDLLATAVCYSTGMLDSQDIQKLTEVLATKEDVCRLERDETPLEERQEVTQTILDRILARLDLMQQRDLVLKERDTRYERWFNQIADKVGITLVP
jgi:hypothetical protein